MSIPGCCPVRAAMGLLRCGVSSWLSEYRPTPTRLLTKTVRGIQTRPFRLGFTQAVEARICNVTADALCAVKPTLKTATEKAMHPLWALHIPSCATNGCLAPSPTWGERVLKATRVLDKLKNVFWLRHLKVNFSKSGLFRW